MSGTWSVVVGDKGRIVLPAALRHSQHLSAGTALVLVETADGVVMSTREQALRLLRGQMSGASLVADLLADRRRASAAEDGS